VEKRERITKKKRRVKREYCNEARNKKKKKITSRGELRK